MCSKILEATVLTTAFVVQTMASTEAKVDYAKRLSRSPLDLTEGQTYGWDDRGAIQTHEFQAGPTNIYYGDEQNTLIIHRVGNEPIELRDVSNGYHKVREEANEDGTYDILYYFVQGDPQEPYATTFIKGKTTDLEWPLNNLGLVYWVYNENIQYDPAMEKFVNEGGPNPRLDNWGDYVPELQQYWKSSNPFYYKHRDFVKRNYGNVRMISEMEFDKADRLLEQLRECSSDVRERLDQIAPRPKPRARTPKRTMNIGAIEYLAERLKLMLEAQKAMLNKHFGSTNTQEYLAKLEAQKST